MYVPPTSVPSEWIGVIVHSVDQIKASCPLGQMFFWDGSLHFLWRHDKTKESCICMSVWHVNYTHRGNMTRLSINNRLNGNLCKYFKLQTVCQTKLQNSSNTSAKLLRHLTILLNVQIKIASDGCLTEPTCLHLWMEDLLMTLKRVVYAEPQGGDKVNRRLYVRIKYMRRNDRNVNTNWAGHPHFRDVNLSNSELNYTIIHLCRSRISYFLWGFNEELIFHNGGWTHAFWCKCCACYGLRQPGEFKIC